MADKETGLNITVGAVADESSAKQAAKDLAKGVLSSLKDGYIEVPAEIKVPIKNASKDLEKAQKDVIDQWKKTFKEGFSSSAKDLDDLTEAYRKFKRLAGKEHKAGTKQYREISKLMGGQIQSYNTQKQARATRRAEQMAKFEKAKQRKTNKKQKGYIDTGAKITNENIEGDIKNRKLRLMKGLKSVLPKGYGSGWINPSSTNDYESKHSEISFYGSKQARQVAQSAREARKWERESLTVDKYDTKEKLEKELAKRRKEDPKFKQSSKKTIVVSQDGKMIPQDVVTEWEVPKSTKPRELSPTEKAGSLSEDIRNNILPELIDKIKTSTDDKEVGELTEKFLNTLEAISKLNQDAGKLIFSDVKKDIGIIMGKLGFTTNGKIGGIDAEEGTDKTAASKDPRIEALMRGLLDKIAEKQDAIKQELIKLEQLEKQTTKTKATKESNSFANRIIAEAHALNASQKQNSQAVVQAVAKDTKAIETQTSYDKVENASERQADIQLETEQKATTEANKQEAEVLESDADTGFNTNARAEKSIEKQSKTNKILNTDIKTRIDKILEKLNQSDAIGFGASQSILETISANVELIANSLKITDIKNTRKNDKYKYPAIIPPDINKAITVAMKKTNLPDLYRYFKDGKWTTAGVISHDKQKPTALHDATDWDKVRQKRLERDIETEREEAIKRNATRSNAVQLSSDLASAYNDHKVLRAIKNAFGIANTGPNANSILGMNQAQIEKLRAERLATFGIPRDNRATSNGDITQVQRRKSIYGWSKTGPNPFENLKLTDGIGIDSKGITDALQTAIQKNMFNAQTGGVMRNLLGSMSLYIGMPSLEKSRKKAEGLNSVMAEIRQVALGLLQVIQARETDLRGMEAKGTAKFDASGMLTSDSSNEAKTIFAQMEDSKMALRGVLADANMVEEVVQQTGGNVAEIIKRLGFAAPELRKCNTILQNMNAGLDQNGKALKFQTRTAEVMNYTFQLMARSVGQMIKRWVLMLNPISLIKKAFQDFASYDVKWQRTMNVIKYNIRRIIRPFMQWLAQQFVNIIGLVNALIKGIGAAFGKNWDLFDQSAASAEQMREELEAAANVTAGFDELHDIGGESSSNPAMDLMGDIYTPQWDGLYEILEKIGSLVGNIIKAVSNWSFWDWLKLAGLALAGYLALKWLLNLFGKGKNPLQAVADGFKFLEKAVGWAILILAFTAFTKALTEFIECMKSANWEDIVKSLVMLGGAFAELYLAAGGLMYLSTALGISAPAMLGVGAVVGAFTLFVKVLTEFIQVMQSADWETIVKSLLMLGGAFAELVLGAGGLMLVATALGMLAPQMAALALVIVAFAPLIASLAMFVEAMKGLTTEDMLNGLLFLAGALTAIAIAIGVVLVVLSAAIASGVGALAILALAGILAVMSLVILALAEFVRALGEAGAGIQLICEGIASVISAIGEVITGIITTVATSIATIVTAIAEGIKTVLEPILEFVESVIGKIVELAETVAKEIGETIRSIIETVGDVILGIINAIAGAIPGLLSAIVGFCRDIGPAIETSVDAICRSITKLVNFTVSAVEYIANLVISAINQFSVQVPDWVPGIGGTRFGFNLQPIAIPRFVPQYEQGTNYVPNDGLAYLHQGEAVVPKKYNTPYQQGNLSNEERVYMQQIMSTMRSLDDTMRRGIAVNGQFTQRGSDLVAVVNKTNSQSGADLLSNVSYAR